MEPSSKKEEVKVLLTKKVQDLQLTVQITVQKIKSLKFNKINIKIIIQKLRCQTKQFISIKLNMLNSKKTDLEEIQIIPR